MKKHTKGIISIVVIVFFIIGMGVSNSHVNKDNVDESSYKKAENKVPLNDVSNDVTNDIDETNGNDKADSIDGKNVNDINKTNDTEDGNKPNDNSKENQSPENHEKLSNISNSENKVKQTHHRAKTNTNKKNRGTHKNESSQKTQGVVYWVPNGKVYHSTPNCPSLSRSKNIRHGSISDSGKLRPCKICH